MRWSLAIVAGMFGLLMAGAASAEEPTECDRLAGSPTDPNRVGVGVGLYGIEPAEAIAACEKALAADPNNPRLLFNLGRAHEAREGIGPWSIAEMALAGRSYKDAADRIYPAAQVVVAGFMWRGEAAFRQEAGEAMRLLAKATASDATETKLRRRELFFDITMPGDPNDAQLTFIEEAADRGDADALYVLGKREKFIGNKADGVLLLHKAAASGSAHAAVDLARMYFRGEGGLAKNPAEALRLIQQAAAGDDPNARWVAALNFENGWDAVSEDEKQAARLFKQASEAGDGYAQYRLGTFYEAGKGGLPQDPREAARLYKLAADQGNDDAVLALAHYMAEGRGGYEADKNKAIEFLKRAARWSNKAKEELTKMSE